MNDRIEDTDHLAWYIVSTADRWRPYHEQVDACVEALDLEDDELAREHEKGYHAGALNMLKDLEGFCTHAQGWDIRAAAQRYADEHDLQIPADEPDPNTWVDDDG